MADEPDTTKGIQRHARTDLTMDDEEKMNSPLLLPGSPGSGSNGGPAANALLLTRVLARVVGRVVRQRWLSSLAVLVTICVSALNVGAWLTILLIFASAAGNPSDEALLEPSGSSRLPSRVQLDRQDSKGRDVCK